MRYLVVSILLSALVASPPVRSSDLLGDLTFEWSDTKIYCSELVWKIYDRALGIQLGGLQKLSDFDLSDEAVRTKMKQRYGENVPLDSPVISPASMFNAEALRNVGT